MVFLQPSDASEVKTTRKKGMKRTRKGEMATWGMGRWMGGPVAL